MDKSKIKQMFEREGYKEISEGEYDNSPYGFLIEFKDGSRTNLNNKYMFFAPKKTKKYSSGNLEAVKKSYYVWDVIYKGVARAGRISEWRGFDAETWISSKELQDINNIINQMKQDGVFENE